MPQGKVAVVIATHQQCYPLDRCIQHHAELLNSAADLIFVDNGSGGELSDWANRNFPDITVLTREKNGFFCGGYNTGLRHALANDYEFVLIVNADTDVVNSNYISALIAAAEQHPKAAFLGPTVYIRKLGNIQNTVLLYPWFLRYMFHWLKAPFIRPNRSKELVVDTEVEFLNGVCVLCRTGALRDIGLMDEIMGGYVEDADWSWRARKHNWLSMYIPTTSIIHHQPRDEYHYYSMKTFMLRRNHVYWHVKEGRQVQAYLFAYTSLGLAWIRAVKASLQNKNAKDHWKYVRHFNKTIKKVLAKRAPEDWFGPPLGKF